MFRDILTAVKKAIIISMIMDRNQFQLPYIMKFNIMYTTPHHTTNFSSFVKEINTIFRRHTEPYAIHLNYTKYVGNNDCYRS